VSAGRIPESDEVILGDNLDVLAGFADSCFRLIYIDPPFNSGRRRSRANLETVADPDGDRQGFGGRRYRSHESTEALSYADAFDDYQGFLAPRLVEAHRLLDERGTLYLHLDYR
jgi:site-specific DNA-methyltransferase (adenine-specific)